MKHRKTDGPGFGGLNTLARLMDTQFRVPGTQIRFGFDALIGLIPGIGDLASLAISSYIISVAKKNGASGFVVSRMVFNVAIDTLIGTIPLAGDLFDIGFKANQRNMQLLHAHFNEGKHKGSSKKLVTPLTILLVLLFAVVVWLLYRMILCIF
jgi:hypothetical protein